MRRARPRRAGAPVAVLALALVGSTLVPASAVAVSPSIRAGWPPSGEPGYSPAIGADGAVYIQFESGLAVLNPDGTRRHAIRSSALGPPVVGRDGRVYAIRQHGEQLMVVTGDGRLQEVGDRVPYGKHGTLVGVSAAGRVALDRSDRQGYRQMEALGAGEVVLRTVSADPGFPDFGIPPRPARLEALAPDGASFWSRDLAAEPAALAGAPDGGVRVALEGGEIAAFDSQGTLQWRDQVPGASAVGVAVNGTAYVVGCTIDGSPCRRGSLTAIAPDGKRRFAVALPGSPVGGIALAPDGTAYVPLSDALVAVTPSGRRRFIMRIPGQATRLTVGRDGSIAFGSTTGADSSNLFVLAGPGAAGPRPTASGLLLSRHRFRSAGPVSICPSGARERCLPATPRGTTIAVRLHEPSRVGIVVRRDGAPRPLVRSRVGDLAAGALWLRFDGRTRPPDPLFGSDPNRWLCGDFSRLCEPLAPGRYRITLVMHGLSGATRTEQAIVTVVAP